MDFRRVGWLLLFTLLFSSCTFQRYYKSKDVHNLLKKSTGTLNQYQKKVAQDYKTKKSAYDALIDSGAETTLAPYPALKRSLDQMQAKSKEFTQAKRDYNQRKKRVEKKIRGKKKIKEGSPAYKELESFRNYVEGSTKKFKSISQGYNAASSQFVKLMKANGIYQVNVPKLQKSVENSMRKMNASIKDSRVKIKQYKKRKNADAETLKKLTEVESLMQSIEGNADKIKGLESQFRKESAGKKVIYVAPHMASYNLVEKMQKHADAIRADAGKINTIGKEIKKAKK
jgi:hypothetical protein